MSTSRSTTNIKQNVPCKIHSYWISCRFCSVVFKGDECGIENMVKHEELKHPAQFEAQKESNFYKIIKSTHLMIDVRPTHPLLKTILKLNKLTARKNSPVKTALNSSSAGDDKELITIESDDEAESRPNTIIKGILTKPPPLVPFLNPKPSTTSSTTTDNNQPYFVHPAPAPAKDDRTCSYCRRTFKFPSVLRVHLATCCVYKGLGGAGASPSPTPEDQEAADKSSQTCTICFKYFLDPENLRKHMALHAINRSSSTNTGSGTAAQVGLSCEFCLKAFRNSILLSQHLKESHDSAKPYNCSHCPGKFNTIHACNLHVQVVHSKQQSAQAQAQEYEEFVANATNTATASVSNNLPISFLYGTSTSTGAATSTSTSACTSYLVCELCSTICLNRMELISHRHIVHRISTAPVSSYTTSDNIQELCSNIPQYSKQPAVALVAGQAQPQQQQQQLTVQQPPQIPLPTRDPRDGDDVENPKKYKCKHCPKILHSQKGKLLHERLKHKQLGVSNNSPGNNPLVGQSAPWGGIGSGGVKCRFCSLWYSNVAIRAIHEKRAHSNELGSWAAKEHAILERRNSREEDGVSEGALVADGAEWMEEVDEAEDESEEADPLAPNSGGEEIQVDVKPSYLTEYMDESGGAGGGGTSASGSGGQDDYTDLLSHPVPIPLQTALLNTGPVSSSSTSANSEPSANSYYCQFCTKPFIAFVNLAIHLDEHDYCATCEKKFSTQSRYRQHLLSDHDRVPKLFCQICCAEFNELEPFVEHCMAVHGGESGGETGSRLGGAAAAVANQRRSEPPPATPPSTTCTKCNLTFASVNMLQRHTNIAHFGIDDHEHGPGGRGIAGQLSRNYGGQTIAASGSSSSAFTCHLCNKNLLTSAALLKHKIFVHNYSGVNTPVSESEHATLNQTISNNHNFINENDDECMIIEDDEEREEPTTTSTSVNTATVSTTKQSQIVYPQAQITQTYNPTTFNPNLNTLVVQPFQHHQAQNTVTTTTRTNQSCTYKCSRCYISFGNVDALREHFKLHHGMTTGHNSTLAVATSFDDQYSSFIDGLGTEDPNDDCDSILS